MQCALYSICNSKRKRIDNGYAIISKVVEKAKTVDGKTISLGTYMRLINIHASFTFTCTLRATYAYTQADIHTR